MKPFLKWKELFYHDWTPTFWWCWLSADQRINVLSAFYYGDLSVDDARCLIEDLSRQTLKWATWTQDNQARENLLSELDH